MYTAGRNATSEWDEMQWEYKIVRARNREFGYREHLEALLREEALAGWIMTEKYNDSQVRFKRHRSSRHNDRFLPAAIDPYRTLYTPPQHRDAQHLHVLLLVIALAVALTAMVLVVLLATLPA